MDPFVDVADDVVARGMEAEGRVPGPAREGGADGVHSAHQDWVAGYEHAWADACGCAWKVCVG